MNKLKKIHAGRYEYKQWEIYYNNGYWIIKEYPIILKFEKLRDTKIFIDGLKKQKD